MNYVRCSDIKRELEEWKSKIAEYKKETNGDGVLLVHAGGLVHLLEILLEKCEVLRIFRKYPKWTGSLEGLLRINKHWKNKNIEVTNELLEIYDIPFDVDEFATIIKWLEGEKE